MDIVVVGLVDIRKFLDVVREWGWGELWYRVRVYGVYRGWVVLWWLCVWRLVFDVMSVKGLKEYGFVYLYKKKVLFF